MKVLHTVAGLWHGTGGPASSIPALCRALAERQGIEVTLLTGEGPLAPSVKELEGAVRVRTVALGPYAFAHASGGFSRACREELEAADVIHSHGIWLHVNWASAHAARMAGKPFVSSPRGMLNPVALERRKLLKRVLWSALDGRHLREAKLLHVTSDPEKRAVRERVPGVPIAMIPNGVDLERLRPLLGRPRPDGGTAPLVSFVGRIHPIKGIDVLLAAWPRVKKDLPDARLVLAGPGEETHVRKLRSELERGGLQDVTYVGPLGEKERDDLLVSSTVLALPSLSENYGMVVVEALACGTPVVASTGTPWSALADEGCGWWVAPTEEAIAGALVAALRTPHVTLREMGERGKRFVERDHGIDSVARKMADCYRWLAAGGPRPACVNGNR